MEEIRDHRVFKRIAGHMSMAFLTWAPDLFIYYAVTMGSLLWEYPDLEPPFAAAVFAAFTINFGPRTVCLPHRDSSNLALGWCAITALGNYDYRKGGHLVLWDLGMVIEFPPGCTIYIPSALICHFNTAIATDEERFSFTCYSADGLFRWVDHGFQKEGEYKLSDLASRNALVDASRWSVGVEHFSTLNNLRGFHQSREASS
ncbi:hypothetical protein PM082_021677 [Marasmius tenuissimus]|nr:hypothetical protein PM082_021677 [Marasmius tenuissimus]